MEHQLVQAPQPASSKHPLDIIILTLFPQQLGDFFLKGIYKKAHDNGLFSIRFINLREFATNRYRSVDDYPFGGKQGMIVTAPIIHAAISSIEHNDEYQLIYMCPKGQVLSQDTVSRIVSSPSRGIIILSGYYEGVDERIFSLFPFERVSIGDIILSSGDLPALVAIEACVRQIPGVLGNPDCIFQDSILSGLLESPQYTAPQSFLGLEVPAVLVGGHHKEIHRWKRREALKQTLFSKSHLLVHYPVDSLDRQLITDILKGDQT